MRVFVAGHRGMLGHVVARYLKENGYQVVTSEERYEAVPNDLLVEDIRRSDCPWVVNALGLIKQKGQDPFALFKANTIFPTHLKRHLQDGQRLIHASSDCVFSGRIGNYSIESEPDPVDTYGLSKLIGEAIADRERATVFRTSIVGPALSDEAGLMAWCLHQRGTVPGYVNHVWNGITTLEWSKACLEVICGKYVPHASVVQLGVSPAVSKYELLQMMATTWNVPIRVEPRDAPERIDRSLQPTWLRSPLVDQMRELHDWY